MRSVALCEWSTSALRAAFVRTGTVNKLPPLLPPLLLVAGGCRVTHRPLAAGGIAAAAAVAAGVVGVLGVDDKDNDNEEDDIDDTGEWLLRRDSIEAVDALLPDGDAPIAAVMAAAGRFIDLPGCCCCCCWST